MRQTALALAACALLGGCQFSPAPLQAGAPDAQSPADAMCQPRCEAGALIGCPTGSTACPLGCIDAAAGMPAHCGAYVPANGLDLAWTTGAGDLEVTDVYVFDTDSGAIWACGFDQPLEVRAAGEGVDTKAGVYFGESDGIGVFAVRNLTVDEVGIVRAIGSNALGLLAAETVVVHGGSIRLVGGARARDLDGACGNKDPVLGDLLYGAVGAGDGGAVGTSASGDGAGQAGADDRDGGGGGGHAAMGGTGGRGGGAGGAAFGGLSPLAGGGGGGGGRGAAIDDCTGVGGGGGGALQISAGQEIEVSLSGLLDTDGITVNGAGGARGNGDCGGGGGAGGTIVLDAPQVLVTGQLTAKGGGGGAGDCNDSSCDGVGPGSSELSYSAFSPDPLAGGANGFSDDEAGGAGGAGSPPPLGQPGLPSGTGSDAGGGGGGAGGHILVRARAGGATVTLGRTSPTAAIGSISTR